MIFRETKLKGAYLIELEPSVDERGFFARTYCQEEFTRHGLTPRIVQCNLSFNRKKSTLRGMHYQADPFGEIKLVSCVSGAIYDVIIDLRRDSPTYRQWLAVELVGAGWTASQSARMLYVPGNFAHGFQTLQDDTTVLYQMSASYYPASAMSVRWNDDAFGIEWPDSNPIMSEKDRRVPDFIR